MERRKAVRSKWEAIISAYEKSSDTQKEFARKRQIKISTLRYWLYKLRMERREEAGTQVDFVEITPHQTFTATTPHRPLAQGCSISVGSAVVELQELPDPRWLAALFFAMEKLS